MCRFVRRSYYLRGLRTRRLRSGWQSGVGGTLNTASVEFWFEFGSTYSYLSAARIQSVAAAAGVPVLWEPFLLGPIFAEQGWDDSPFNVYLAKVTSQRWLREFAQAVFRANFAEDRDIEDGTVIRSILDQLGQSGAQLIEQAQAPENKVRLRQQ